MKTLTLFVSPILVALAFSLPHPLYGMEEISKDPTFGKPLPALSSALYHQVATEQYRVQRDMVHQEVLVQKKKSGLADVDQQELQTQIELKEKELGVLHKKHMKNTFDTTSKVVMAELCSSQELLENINLETLEALFARAIELPYVSYKEENDKAQIYMTQLEAIIKNLDNRNREDMVAFQMGEYAIKDNTIKNNWDLLKPKMDALFINSNLTFQKPNHEEQLAQLEDILELYGYRGYHGHRYVNKSSDLSPLMDVFLRQSPYGALGLFLTSLDYTPVTSWIHADQLSLCARLNAEQKPSEYLETIEEIVFKILGRHLNKRVLGLIHDNFKAVIEKSETTNNQ